MSQDCFKHQKSVYIHVNLVYQLQKSQLKERQKPAHDIHRRNVQEYIYMAKSTKSPKLNFVLNTFKEFNNVLN